MSKYHKENMVTVKMEDGSEKEIPRRKARRIHQDIEKGDHTFRCFSDKAYLLKKDGSIHSGKPKVTKAERKALKRAKVKELKLKVASPALLRAL